MIGIRIVYYSTFFTHFHNNKEEACNCLFTQQELAVNRIVFRTNEMAKHGEDNCVFMILSSLAIFVLQYPLYAMCNIGG